MSKNGYRTTRKSGVYLHGKKKTGHKKNYQLYWIGGGCLLLVAILVVVLLFGMGDGEQNPPSQSTTKSTTTSVTTTTTTTTPTTATTTITTTTKKTTTKKPTQTSPTTTVDFLDPTGHYIQTDRSQWNLLLVNAWNPIDETYENNIEMANFRSSSKYKFDSRAIDALERMMKDGSKYGLYAVSFYRPRKTQETLFKNRIQRYINSGYSRAEAEKKAPTVVAAPGTSEHQTGLAADILGSGYSSLTKGFENTKAFKWLKEHCAEYGFILRYPKDKQPITGVIYEPWHYRYVGVEHATAIMEQEICLEEYLEQIGG